MFKLTIKTPERLSTVIIVNFGHIPTPFSSVSDDDKIYVCWVPPYQFISAQITYVQKSWWNTSLKEKPVFNSSQQFFPEYSVSLFL